MQILSYRWDMIPKRLFFFFLKKVPLNLSNVDPVYRNEPGPRFLLLKARLGLPGHSETPLPGLDLGQVYHLGLGFPQLS